MYYEVLEAGLEYKPASFISRVKNIIEILEARACIQGNTVFTKFYTSDIITLSDSFEVVYHVYYRQVVSTFTRSTRKSFFNSDWIL